MPICYLAPKSVKSTFHPKKPTVRSALFLNAPFAADIWGVQSRMNNTGRMITNG
ncbi:hypothetical protein VC82_134 [Flagellimonas lutaonensis]|uniref:Uncharacterized protein n=1 Tax=Flagellimonas lutaonensis TaxID=516051 RepID=A0A0D5YPQ8_9FLAO|nr:hypothetical protein VC82_134 [Allomuricauda lutaonensis]